MSLLENNIKTKKHPSKLFKIKKLLKKILIIKNEFKNSANFYLQLQLTQTADQENSVQFNIQRIWKASQGKYFLLKIKE